MEAKLPGTRVTGGCWLPHVSREWNQGPLGEQQVLLPTGPSHQLH